MREHNHSHNTADLSQKNEDVTQPAQFAASQSANTLLHKLCVILIIPYDIIFAYKCARPSFCQK